MSDQIIFLAMVFGAVFLLATALIVPTFGTEAQAAKRMRTRIKTVVSSFDPAAVSLLRESHLRKLSPLEQTMERHFPGTANLVTMIDQAGWTIPAYRLILLAGALAIAAGMIVAVFSPIPWLGLLMPIVVFPIPFLKLKIDRQKRLSEFEAQLPDALSIMSRAMRAGHPFVETLQLVADELNNPLAQEFRATFSDLNYGMTEKTAFMGLLARIPSVSLMAVVTAVLVQREAGGNMTEILDKIAAVVRARFRFQRRVRTLSAEGRMSAWILTLVPFVLAAGIALISPGYLPMLTKDPLGQKLVLVAFTSIIIGIFWIRRIIRLDA
ncbi:MAG: type II secretion system F family protein [Methylococcaceae bacterium]|nr:type II secretion system F family protein [Methylococcaceae bacterium]